MSPTLCYRNKAMSKDQMSALWRLVFARKELFHSHQQSPFPLCNQSNCFSPGLVTYKSIMPEDSGVKVRSKKNFFLCSLHTTLLYWSTFCVWIIFNRTRKLSGKSISRKLKECDTWESTGIWLENVPKLRIFTVESILRLFLFVC